MRTDVLRFVLALAVLVPFGSAWGQAAPESIVAEGVPTIPRELARALNRYQHARSATFAGWLADRREILILTRFADTPQVHHVALPGGARTQLTFLRERVLGAVPRPGRDQYVLSTDEGGAENYQLDWHDVAAATSRRLTDGKSRNILAGWSNSGQWLAWSGNARNGKDMDLYVADPDDPKSARRVKEVSGSWTVTDWSPDDRRLVAVEYVSINESYVHLIEVATGATETVAPRSKSPAPTVAYSSVRWSQDGKSLYWLSDLDSEFRRLARYDLATKKVTPLTAEIPWDVEEFDLSDRGTIALVANEDGISRLHLIEALSGREIVGPRLPSGLIHGVTFRRQAQEFAFATSSARAPGDVYSYDVATGALQRWTSSETGGLNANRFAEPELVHYPTFDGRQIPAFVYRPDAQKFPGPRPVFINIHGGPESQTRPGFLGWMNYWVDELGVALVFPNVRGSAGYGKSYLKLDNGFQREDSVKDIGALLDWVGKQAGLDARRVAVNGGSYGGYMSLATLTHYNDRLKAGIDVVGISNFVTFLKNTQDYRRDLRRAEYGDERDPKMKAHLEKISPLSSAEKIRVPLLVVQGKNDPRVPITEAEQMLAAVRKQGGPVWYILGKNEGHGFAKKPNQDYLQAAEVLFLKKHLLGEGD